VESTGFLLRAAERRLGRNIRHQHLFELIDAVLQCELSFLQSTNQQIFRRRVIDQVIDNLVKIAMFQLQFMQLARTSLISISVSG
jgi:hypothetical protein